MCSSSPLFVLQAVCCSDHLHCCPTGTRCDLTLSMCVQGPEGPSAAVKITAALGPEPLAPKSSGQTAVDDVVLLTKVYLLKTTGCYFF